MHTATLHELFLANERIEKSIIAHVHAMTDEQAARLLRTLVLAERIAQEPPPPAPAHAEPVKLTPDETAGVDDTLTFNYVENRP